MSKFSLHDRDFDSVKAEIPKSKKVFEIIKLDKDEYCLLEHIGDSVGEIATFTKTELLVLWQMLTTER